MDISCNDQGTIFILTPLTDAGEAWCDEYIPHATRWGGGYVVEHRYVAPILDGMHDGGLLVGEGV